MAPAPDTAAGRRVPALLRLERDLFGAWLQVRASMWWMAGGVPGVVLRSWNVFVLGGGLFCFVCGGLGSIFPDVLPPPGQWKDVNECLGKWVAFQGVTPVP